MTGHVLSLTYVLPLRACAPPDGEFSDYVNDLSRWCEVILIDGSPEPVFRAVDAKCDGNVRHLPPDAALASLSNGKVQGVLTGLRLASHDQVVIADDDVRYEVTDLMQIVAALDNAELVRPQNYFDPLPWHARIDTARTLINRMTGGDWPGTLALRRSILGATPEYDGNVLFENLELVRTVEAFGGRVRSFEDLFIRRLPPSTRHFWRQRVRQAYDEFARPWRLSLALAVLPLLVALVATRQWWGVLGLAIMAIVVAELGRQRARGTQVFPRSASFCAPVWLLERGVSSWLAVTARILRGGMLYNGQRVVKAANSRAALRESRGSRSGTA